MRNLEVDPRLPSDPVTPSYVEKGNLLASLLAEAIEHLWPWQRGRFSMGRTALALLAGGAVLALFALMLGSSGHLATGIAIGAWAGWCLFEIIERKGSKPYVKDGPWWQ
ncbi:hypothetical protein RZS08_54895, partial [Arthrospira platensis SPKY1]|nr:hypothetical protein [Arthrospira platensis SPKY1]